MAKPSDATRLDAYQDLAQRQARMTEDYAQRMSGDGAPDPQKIAEAVTRRYGEISQWKNTGVLLGLQEKASPGVPGNAYGNAIG